MYKCCVVKIKVHYVQVLCGGDNGFHVLLTQWYTFIYVCCMSETTVHVLFSAKPITMMFTNLYFFLYPDQ